MAGNWNNDDPQNPLRALLANRALWGRAGGLLFDGQPGTHNHMEAANAGQAQDILTRDPRYYQRTMSGGSEAGGGEERFGLNDTAQRSFRRNGETWTQLRNLDVGGDANNVIDPSLVEYDEEFGMMTPASNLRADVNAEGGDLATFIIGGGMLGGATGAHAMGINQGVATAGTSFESLPSLSMPQMNAMGPDFAMGGAGAGAAGGGGLGNLGAEAINYETLPNLPMQQTAQFPSDPSLLSRAGTWAANNPMQAARGAMGLASLGAGLGGGSGGGGGGSSGDASSIIEEMANANRVNHNTPLGSRNWSKGPDGRWTVNDTMDPAEEANFRNVQGMNSSVTDMARQRLAALLAQGPSPRADRPINAHGFNIGG